MQLVKIQIVYSDKEQTLATSICSNKNCFTTIDHLNRLNLILVKKKTVLSEGKNYDNNLANFNKNIINLHLIILIWKGYHG